MERSNQDNEIYSGSVTKLFFALLHSPSTTLESSKHYVDKAPFRRRKPYNVAYVIFQH